MGCNCNRNYDNGYYDGGYYDNGYYDNGYYDNGYYDNNYYGKGYPSYYSAPYNDGNGFNQFSPFCGQGNNVRRRRSPFHEKTVFFSNEVDSFCR